MERIRFLWDNLFDGGSITASSEDSDFPVTNIRHRWHTRAWRSTGVSSEWVKCDLASAQDIRVFVFKYHNLTSSATLKIQANSSDSWSSPPVDQTLVYGTDWNDSHGVYFWDTNQSYRWWRFTLADSGNSDGYLSIGRIFLGDFFEPTYNFTDAHRVRYTDPSTKMYSSGGQVSVASKPHFRFWEYNFALVKSPDERTFETIFDAVGQSVPYFICQDADDKLSTLYYVQNATDWELEHIAMDTWFRLPIVVEEMR